MHELSQKTIQPIQRLTVVGTATTGMCASWLMRLPRVMRCSRIWSNSTPDLASDMTLCVWVWGEMDPWD